jgi:preprotein translocase subunit SecA
MSFIETDLSTFLEVFKNLDASTKPLWGNMSAQRMVEHLTDGINMSRGIGDHQLTVPAEKAEQLKQFLHTDKPMAQNIQVPFALPNTALRNADLDDAIDEFTITWVDYEEEQELEPEKQAIHPFYGNLTLEEWLKVHAKHFTHHFKQFGLME